MSRFKTNKVANSRFMPRSQALRVIPIVVHNDIYHIHSRRVADSFQGYVVHNDEFYCYLPTMERESDLLDEAERRIRNLL